MGRRRLGIGIARDRVSAVLLAGNTLCWAATRQRDDDTGLSEALRALLAACPRRGVLPIPVTAALGPSVSQLKCLTELPPVADRRALEAVVRESAGRFFLRNGVPLLVSEALVEAPDRVWIAAFDKPVVAEIAKACHEAGMPLRMVVPTAMALRRAIRDSSITWSDGDVQLHITYGATAPSSVRRIPATGGTTSPPLLVASLAAIGGSSRDALDAAGAALTERGDAVVARRADLATPTRSTRRALTRAAVFCGLALVVALASPGLAASLALRGDRARAAAIAARASAAQRDATELAATSTALRLLSDFVASRQSMTLLLADVTRGLPDNAALVAFQIDSSGLGSLVAVAPHAAVVVDAVERMPGLTTPQIIGPVTREDVGGRSIERVTIQFRLLPPRIP